MIKNESETTEDKIAIENIRKKYKISRNDAIVLKLLDEMVSLYEKFLTNTILIDKKPEDDKYQIEIPVTDFYDELQGLTISIVDIESAISVSHPQLVQYFNITLTDFRTKIENLKSKGEKQIVLQLRIQIRNFQRKLSDLIKSDEPETLIESYPSKQEDRANKLWTSGLKKLAKHEKATILLYWLVRNGRGVPLNKRDISIQKRETESWVEKQLQAIKENAPELLDFSSDSDGHTTYCVPKAFHQFYLGGKSND